MAVSQPAVWHRTIRVREYVGLRFEGPGLGLLMVESMFPAILGFRDVSTLLRKGPSHGHDETQGYSPPLTVSERACSASYEREPSRAP